MKKLIRSRYIVALGPAMAVVIGAKELLELLPLETGMIWFLLGIILLISYVSSLAIFKAKPMNHLNTFTTTGARKLKTVLSDERREEIKEKSQQAAKKMEKEQQNYIKEKKKEEENLSEDEQRERLRSPVWHTIKNTDSPTGKRLVVGLRNQGCTYRQKHPPGCFMCGFDARILHSLCPNKKDLDRQLFSAIAHALNSSEQFDTLEFLGDGSFLCDEEIGDDTKSDLFDRINKYPTIKRVLVETRPEDIERGDIEILINNLTHKQKLELGFGLETADDFIREYCINKGFTLEEFEESLDKIAKEDKFTSRVSIVVYLLLKPPFLTEYESLIDVMNSLKYLKKLQRRKQIKIIPKIEPAVIASHTVLDILNRENSYDPVSYWTVAEVIMRAHRLGLSKSIRIGGRYDMFDAEMIPGVYSQDHEGMLHKYDFIIYDAMMAFNVHHNIRRLLADLEEAIVQDCFIRWKEDMFENSNQCSLCNYYSQKYSRPIKFLKKTKNYKNKAKEQERIFRALDEIQYQNVEVRGLLSPAVKCKGFCNDDFDTSNIRDLFGDIFESKGLNCDVKIVECYMQRNKLCRIFFKLIDFDPPYDVDEIWVTIPVQ